MPLALSPPSSRPSLGRPRWGGKDVPLSSGLHASWLRALTSLLPRSRQECGGAGSSPNGQPGRPWHCEFQGSLVGCPHPRKGRCGSAVPVSRGAGCGGSAGRDPARQVRGAAGPPPAHWPWRGSFPPSFSFNCLLAKPPQMGPPDQTGQPACGREEGPRGTLGTIGSVGPEGAWVWSLRSVSFSLMLEAENRAEVLLVVSAFSFFGCARSRRTFPGLGCKSHHCGDNARSLTARPPGNSPWCLFYFKSIHTTVVGQPEGVAERQARLRACARAHSGPLAT